MPYSAEHMHLPSPALSTPSIGSLEANGCGPEGCGRTTVGEARARRALRRTMLEGGIGITVRYILRCAGAGEGRETWKTLEMAMAWGTCALSDYRV